MKDTMIPTVSKTNTFNIVTQFHSEFEFGIEIEDIIKKYNESMLEPTYQEVENHLKCLIDDGLIRYVEPVEKEPTQQ